MRKLVSAAMCMLFLTVAYGSDRCAQGNCFTCTSEKKCAWVPSNVQSMHGHGKCYDTTLPGSIVKDLFEGAFVGNLATIRITKFGQCFDEDPEAVKGALQFAIFVMILVIVLCATLLHSYACYIYLCCTTAHQINKLKRKIEIMQKNL